MTNGWAPGLRPDWKDRSMPITAVHQDPEQLTMTVVAAFPVSVKRLWDAYADARQLERFWGPPAYPATFTRHDMVEGGCSTYSMVGPDGDVSRGYWEFLEVDPPRRFEVRDGFARPDGSPNAEMPSMRMVFEFAESDEGSQVTATTFFDTVDGMERLLEMGIEQGMREAMGQIDDVVTA